MNNVDQKTISRITSKYPKGSWSLEIFDWLWSDLTAKHPDIWCSHTTRYVGLYTYRSSRKLFARIDLQSPFMLIGIRKVDWERLQPEFVTSTSFPDWEGSNPLIGFKLADKEPEIIDILDACYISRIFGPQSISPLLTKQKRADANAESRTKLGSDAVMRRAAHSHEQAKKKQKRDFDVSKLQEPIVAEEIADRYEGEKRQITINSYERDPEARKLCIRKHGYHCAVCKMNFADEFGDIGKSYIHVHHKHSFGESGVARVTHSENDLVPLCPNCHAMAHRRTPPFDVEELKKKRANAKRCLARKRTEQKRGSKK